MRSTTCNHPKKIDKIFTPSLGLPRKDDRKKVANPISKLVQGQLVICNFQENPLKEDLITNQKSSSAFPYLVPTT